MKGVLGLSCTIFSLPEELLVEILALVASSSFFDLLHAKLSCRALNDIAEKNKAYIYKQVSLEGLPWPNRNREQVSSFLRKLTEYQNPQALYHQGLVEYFANKDLEKGKEYIKASSNSGYEAASYIFGIMMACDESCKSSQELGMRLLKNIMMKDKKKKKTNSLLRECREKFKDAERNCRYFQKLKPNPNSCQMKYEHKKLMLKKESIWLTEIEQAEEIECEECRCHREVTYICNWLLGHSIYKY